MRRGRAAHSSMVRKRLSVRDESSSGRRDASARSPTMWKGRRARTTRGVRPRMSATRATAMWRRQTRKRERERERPRNAMPVAATNMATERRGVGRHLSIIVVVRPPTVQMLQEFEHGPLRNTAGRSTLGAEIVAKWDLLARIWTNNGLAGDDDDDERRAPRNDWRRQISPRTDDD